MYGACRFIRDAACHRSSNLHVDHAWAVHMVLLVAQIGTIYRGLPYFNPTDLRTGAPKNHLISKSINNSIKILPDVERAECLASE